MEIRTESKTGKRVRSLPDIVAAIGKQLDSRQKVWLQELAEDPTRFAELELQVHDAFQHLADDLVAGLLAQAAQQPQLAEDVKKK